MMPAPNQSGFWAIIKELFFNNQTLILYIKRNKFLSLFFASSAFLFLMVLFITEQAIQYREKSVQLKIENEQLNQALASKQDYEKLYTSCSADLEKAKRIPVVANCPDPKPTPRHNDNPIQTAIVPRTYDDGLRKKLDDIRW